MKTEMKKEPGISNILYWTLQTAAVLLVLTCAMASEAGMVKSGPAQMQDMRMAQMERSL